MPGFIDRKEAERDAAIRVAADAQQKRIQQATGEAEMLRLASERSEEIVKLRLKQERQLRDQAAILYNQSPYPSLLERLQHVCGKDMYIAHSDDPSRSWTHYDRQPDFPKSSYLVKACWTINNMSELPSFIDRYHAWVEYEKTGWWARLGFYLESRADGVLIGHARKRLTSSFSAVGSNSDLTQDFIEKLYYSPRVLEQSGSKNHAPRRDLGSFSSVDQTGRSGG